MNAENANTRMAAFKGVANKSAVAGKATALPTDVLAWHKQLSDEATKSGKKR